MLECGFGKPGKERIAQMQSASLSDEQIVQAFVRDYGPGIYLSPPNAFGWIVPYAAALSVLLVILLFVMKYRKPKPITDIGDPRIEDPEIEDPELAKYKDQIEKQMAKLDS